MKVYLKQKLYGYLFLSKSGGIINNEK